MTEHVRDDQFFHFDPDIHEMYLDGERITNEMLERLAAYAAAPTDADPARLRQLAGLTPGGKSLTDGGATHSPRFQVVLGEATAAKARAAAKKADMSMSKWLRQLVEEKVA